MKLKGIDMNMEKERLIWKSFDRAIDEQYLGSGVLPHADIKLSKQLSIFFGQATSPKVQAMKMLAVNEMFTNHTSVYQTKNNERGVEITFTAGSKWFAARLQVGYMGIGVAVIADDKEVWQSGCRFHSDALKGRTSYDQILNELIAKVVHVSNQLDAAMIEVIEKY